MVLGIGELEKVDGKWRIVYLGTDIHDDLEKVADCGGIFMLHDGWWEEVYCGETEHFSGEIYQDGKDIVYEGTVVYMRCGGKKTNKIPTPGAPLGKWVACKIYTDEYWEIEGGMLVRVPESMYQVDGIAGTWGMEPRGRAVCEVLWEEGGRYKRLGRVALKLSKLPFPKEMWFFDGCEYRETGLKLYWRNEEIALTRQFFGEIDLETIFWLL